MKKRKLGSDGSPESGRNDDSSAESEHVGAVGVVTSPTFSSLFSVTPSISISISPTSSCSSAADEKRAYRKHRRRLARIVTEQWRYFARSRILSLRFRKIRVEQLKRCAFLSWQEFVSEKIQSRERAVELGRRAGTRRFFKRLLKYGKRSKQIANTRSSFMRRRYLAAPFSALREYADLRVLQFKRTVKAHHYHLLAMYSRAFSDWRIALQLKRRKKFYENVALAKWAFSAKRWALRRWRRAAAKTLNYDSDSEGTEGSADSILEKAQEDTLLLVVDGHFRRLKQRHVFSEWLEILQDSRAADASAVRCHQRNFLKRAARHWREHAANKRFRREQGEAVQRAWKMYILRRNTTSWSAYARCRKLRVQQKQMADSCSKWSVLRKYASRWKNHHLFRTAKDEETRFALRHRTSRLLKSCMKGWVEYHLLRCSRRVQYSEACSRRTDVTLRRFIRQWLLSATELREKREREQHAVQTRRNAVMSCSFLGMRKACRDQKLRAEQLGRLKGALDFLRLSNAWSGWKHFSGRRGAKQAEIERAESMFKRRRRLSVLQAWRCYVEETRARENGEAAAGRQLCYDRLLQKLALLGWVQVQKSKPQRRPSADEVLSRGSAVVDSKHTVRVRPPPRRPSFVMCDAASPHSSSLDDSLSGDHKVEESMEQVHAAFTSACSRDVYLPAKRAVGCEMKDISNEIRGRTQQQDFEAAAELELLAAEVAWMEDLLATYHDLSTELVQKKAELAVLEKNSAGSKQAGVLSQKIWLLQQRRAILLPTIQAVSATVPSLRLRARRCSSAS